MELKEIKGLGSKRLSALNDCGITTSIDLLNYYPYKYYDFTKFDEYSPNASANLILKVECVGEPKIVYFSRLNYVIAKMKDETSGGSFNAVWYNQTFMKNALSVGTKYILIGKVNNKKQLVVTKCINATNLKGDVLPVYKSLEGISSGIIKNSVDELLSQYKETSYITSDIEKLFNLQSLESAYKTVHSPAETQAIDEAKDRIDLEKFLLFASLEEYQKKNKQTKDFKYNNVNLEKFEEKLPFSLTESQKMAIDEIYNDLDSSIAMNRLVLGDVGSGKTMVAFASVFKAVESGFQAVMLCPTEILASQHYKNAEKIFGEKVCLLHSKMPEREQKEIRKRIECSECLFVIGTHSVLSEKVIFNNLSLVITDEQHRFGVGQRASLSSKAKVTDCLIMSATPIPRSLSLVLFGGLSVSRINARPKGESKIKTNIMSMNKTKDMWNFVAKKITEEQSKCFVVVSRISSKNDEEEDLISVEGLKKELEKDKIIDSNLICYLHGKMANEEKEKVVCQFKSGEKRLLVSTTVVEVGVDISDANIMIIFNSERFGLASLHQLRGRVGRNGDEGFCLCVVSNANELTMQRLKVFKENNDGLKIAEEDLKIRGAGSIYGQNQHGVSEVYQSLNFNIDLYETAQKIYKELSVSQQEVILNDANNLYGKMFKQIVLN